MLVKCYIPRKYYAELRKEYAELNGKVTGELFDIVEIEVEDSFLNKIHDPRLINLNNMETVREFATRTTYLHLNMPIEGIHACIRDHPFLENLQIQVLPRNAWGHWTGVKIYLPPPEEALIMLDDALVKFLVRDAT